MGVGRRGVVEDVVGGEELVVGDFVAGAVVAREGEG